MHALGDDMGQRTLTIAFAVTLIAAGMLQASTATAQSYDQLKKWCYGDATEDQTIQGCNAVVKAGKETEAGIADAIGNRGLAYKNKGEYERAIQDYNEAIRRNPSNANNYNLRGSAYDEIKQHDRAIEDYNMALKLRPKFASAFNNRGVAYRNKGQFARAIQDYDEALKIDPNYKIAIDNREFAVKQLDK
jgi:tetratricopeptide (TPR) repeat protein